MGVVIFWHIHCIAIIEQEDLKIWRRMFKTHKTKAMDIKKSNHVNLEEKRSSFLLMGAVTVLSFTLMAFEYSKISDSSAKEQPGLYIDLIETEIVPISIPEVDKPIEIAKQQLSNVIEIVKELTVTEPSEKVKEPDFSSVTPNFGVVDIPVEVIVEEKEFTIVEEMPSFPGGEEALFSYLSTHIDFPQMAVDANITGTVYVQFVVNKKGEIEKFKLLRGIGGGCDEEAQRVILSMPKWNPGKQRGKPVNVRFNMPIRFSLK